MPTEYSVIEQHHSELFYFLMSKGCEAVCKEWNNRLKYEVMTTEKYKDKIQVASHPFPQLTRMGNYSSKNLFVIYFWDAKEKQYGPIKEYHIITELLSDQINVCLEVKKMHIFRVYDGSI